jgi:hypothetical protein
MRRHKRANSAADSKRDHHCHAIRGALMNVGRVIEKSEAQGIDLYRFQPVPGKGATLPKSYKGTSGGGLWCIYTKQEADGPPVSCAVKAGGRCLLGKARRGRVADHLPRPAQHLSRALRCNQKRIFVTDMHDQCRSIVYLGIFRQNLPAFVGSLAMASDRSQASHRARTPTPSLGLAAWRRESSHRDYRRRPRQAA